MPVTRNLLRTVTASLAILPNAGFALGLGSIEVESTLDQPLEARIPIVSLRPGEIEGLSAGLASRELFERMGFERPMLLSQLQFSVEERGGNKPYIRVTSSSPVREPLLDLLVEVRWASGRLLRDYAVLLDPPITVRRPRPANAIAPYTAGSSSRTPVSEPSRATAQTRTGTSRSAPRSQPVSGFDGSDYGPVQPGETLWVIASDTRPDRSVSVQQMMLALLRANPDAFFAPNVNSLSAGAVLRVPKLEEIASLTKDEALRRVEQQNEQRVSGTDASGSDQVAVKLVKPGSDMALADEDQSVVPQAGAVGGTAEQGPAVGDSNSALIRLENGGMSLQLAGMDDLNSHIPTIVAVDDVTLAASAVSDVMNDQMAVSPDVAGLTANSITMPGNIEALRANGQGQAMMEAGAAKFASQAGDPPAPSQPAANWGSPLTDSAAEVGPAFDPSSADVVQSAAGALTAADAPSMTSTQATPTSQAVDANADPQRAPMSAIEDMPPVGEGTWEVTEWNESTVPASERADMDWQAAADDPATVAMMPSGLQTILTMLTDPRYLAMAGGGVLLFLLLLLLVLRMALRRGASEMPQVNTRPSQQSELAKGPTLVAAMPAAAVGLESPMSPPAHTDSGSEERVDPAAKVDVLMSMGDYSQAAELLQGALNHQSERDDLAYKLLEARHAEGNEAGYLEAVENHRTLLENGPLWEQVLAMGSELAPEHPLFVVAEEGDEGGLFGVLEPPQEAPLEDTAMMPVPPMPPPPPQSVSTTSDASADVLEFVAPEKDEQAIEAQSPTEVELDLDGGLEFDLGTFSLDEETEQSQSGSESGVGEALEEEFGKLGDEDVDHLDLQDEALKLGGNPAAVAPEDASESEPSVNAEVLEFPAPPEATDAGGVSAPSDGEDSDESSFVDTKLDLATAYLEMGDNSGARTLYQEVIEEGNAAQRQEAQDGLDRIGFG